MNELTGKKLIHLRREVDVPFTVSVRRRGVTSRLVLLRILRLLPGKRVVGLAECEGQRVLVKIFLGRTGGRYATRERTGVEAMVRTGIRTPELLWQAELAGGFGQVLAFEFLEDAINLFDMWESARGHEQRVDVLTRAMIVIARMHNGGVMQTDIHLNNFLLAEGRLYAIDGGGVVAERDRRSLDEARSLANLSEFFAQFYSRFDDLVPTVLPGYEAVREWRFLPERVLRLEASIVQQRDSRKRNYIGKAFRECTRFICRQNFFRFEVCDRSAYGEGLEKLLADPDAAMAAGETLKDGNTTTVALVRTEDRELVVKRYNIKGWGYGLRRLFRKSRAWHCWSNACRMEFLGIPSLRPIALIESRFGPLRGRAYFVTEYVTGPDALEQFGQGDVSESELGQLVDVLGDLRAARISHGDMKATNFLMAPDGPVVIDLDAMKEHTNAERFERAFERDINRFMKNWNGRPDVKARFAALLARLGDDVDASEDVLQPDPIR